MPINNTNYSGGASIQFKENGGSREIAVKGSYVSEDQFVIASLVPNTAFNTTPILLTFNAGQQVSRQSFYDWASTNGFEVTEDAVDKQAPYIVSTAVNGGKTVFTITFDKNINITGNNAALKAAITYAANGTTYSALGGSDSVNTPNGSGATVVITLNSASVTTTNRFKIAQGVIVDAQGNIVPNILTTTAV